MRAVYKFRLEHNRTDCIYGVFVAEEKHIKKLIESKIQVYFGEVNHNTYVSSALDTDNIQFITNDDFVVSIFDKYDLSSGYNPLHYESCNFDYESLGLYCDENFIETILDKLIELENN